MIEIRPELVEIEVGENTVLALDDAELVDDHGRPRPLRRSAARALVEDDPATREQLAAPDTPRLLTLERIREALLAQGALGANRLGASDVEDMTITLEAASNPSFRSFAPSPLGSPDTAGERPLYRFRRADLALIDTEAEALVHDIDVLDGLMRTMTLDDPRRPRLLQTLTRTLDAWRLAHATNRSSTSTPTAG